MNLNVKCYNIVKCIEQDIHETYALYITIMLFFLNVTVLCSVDSPIILFPENNTIGDVVTSLRADAEVTASIIKQDPAGYFSILGLDLLAIVVLDYEVAYETFNKKYMINCVVLHVSTTIISLCK